MHPLYTHLPARTKDGKYPPIPPILYFSTGVKPYRGLNGKRPKNRNIGNKHKGNGKMINDKLINVKVDADVPLNIWNGYLKKYNDKYQTVFDELGTCQIRLLKGLGFIQPYSIIHKRLVAVMSFRSVRHKSGFKSKMVKTRLHGLEITQEGDTDICVSFPESIINKAVGLFLIRRRKHISVEHHKHLVLLAKQMGAAPKATPSNKCGRY